MAVGQIVSGVFLSVLAVVGASLLAESGYNNYKYGQFTVSVSEDTQYRYDLVYKNVREFLQNELFAKSGEKQKSNDFDKAFNKLVHRTTLLLMKTIDNLKDPDLLDIFSDHRIGSLLRLLSKAEFIYGTNGNGLLDERDHEYFRTVYPEVRSLGNCIHHEKGKFWEGDNNCQIHFKSWNDKDCVSGDYKAMGVKLSLSNPWGEEY